MPRLKNNRKRRHDLIQFWILRIAFNPEVSEAAGTYSGQTHYLKVDFCPFKSLYYKTKEDVKIYTALQQEMKSGADAMPARFR